MAKPTREDVSLIAYEIYPQSEMSLTPSPFSRDWMDQTYKRFAYRCLPLTLANQAGWVINCPVSFSARWNGGPLAEDTVIAFDDIYDSRISSLFGHGTVTFNIPYLFRTPEGINLWVKGPTNWPKDGVQALEGFVETDWTSASFTMNWKLTRPDNVVRFERGEPICMVLPYPRGLLESCLPKCVPLSENKELEQAYRRWSAEREEFQQRVAARDVDAIEVGWQKNYFQGRDPGGDPFAGHQTRLSLRPFERDGEKIVGQIFQPASNPRPAPQLHTAIQRHQAGDFAGARALYAQILETDGDHADALHLLGVVCQ